MPDVAISKDEPKATILSHRRESMQRAAGKRFVGFPDPSHDQRGNAHKLLSTYISCIFPFGNPKFRG